MIYNQNLDDKTLDPAVVVWTRDRAAMVKWVASKISDLYSDKKDLTSNKTTNQIIVSWLDSPELEQKYTQYEKINEEKKEVLDQ